MASEDTCSGLAVAGVVGKEIWSWNAALSQYSGCTSLTWLLSSSGHAEKHLNLQSNEKSISLSAKNPALGVPSPVRAARMDKPIRHGRQAHKPQYKPQFSGLYLEQSPSFRSTQIHELRLRWSRSHILGVECGGGQWLSNNPIREIELHSGFFLSQAFPDPARV